MRTATTTLLLFFLLLHASCSGAANRSAAQLHADIDSLWQKEFNSAKDIIDNFTAIEKQIGKENALLHTKNLCHYIWHSGEYMFRCRGKNEDIALLPQNIEEIALDDAIVESYMIERDTARFVDHYFTLKAMERGDNFNEARDGITITVFYHPRSMNSNDYAKMKAVFSCKNDALHIAYMKKLKFPFRNSGCNEEFYAIRPLIEKNVKESILKREIISLFNNYRNIMPGEKAPAPILYDKEGKEHTFSEFNGKVLVIDVWATWCSSCLAKMPQYIALRNSYSNNPDIEFITVSIDRTGAKEKWLAALEKRKMDGMLNLMPDCEYESQFESEYHVSGVPRYIIIDRQGKIVTSYAPPPGGGMEEIITKTLTKTDNN